MLVKVFVMTNRFRVLKLHAGILDVRSTLLRAEHQSPYVGV